MLRQLSCGKLPCSVVKFVRAELLADKRSRSVGFDCKGEGQNYGVISKATPP